MELLPRLIAASLDQCLREMAAPAPVGHDLQWELLDEGKARALQGSALFYFTERSGGRLRQLTAYSVVDVSRLLTLDRNLLTERIASLPPQVIVDIEVGVQLALSL